MDQQQPPTGSLKVDDGLEVGFNPYGNSFNRVCYKLQHAHADWQSADNFNTLQRLQIEEP